MARMCPQCGEIHFDTSSGPRATHCRKCNSDLNEAAGLMPTTHLEQAQSGQSAPKPTAKQLFSSWGKTPGFKGIVVGLCLIAAAGMMLYLGWDWYSRVKEATAVCHTAAPETPKDARRNHITATYTIGSKKYPQYPGVRAEGTPFTIYYLPEEPAVGYEARPFLWLVIGGKVLLIGLGVLVFGIMKFSVTRAQAADYERTMAQAG